MRFLSSPSQLIDFASNDYLGFAKSEPLAKLFAAVIQHNPYHGSTGSRLLTGNSYAAMETEEFLARRWKLPAVLIFPTGYMANLGLLSCIGDRHTTFLYDHLVHASIKDGMRLSNAKKISFLHNDIEHLERRLSQQSGKCYVIVESIYSMGGDFAPLEEISAVCKKYSARLIVDEAHATGVYGEMGGGLSEMLNIETFARINTFGKALGLHGACVSGSADLKQLLVNQSRPFIYTTAPPPTLFLQIKVAFEFLDSQLYSKKKLKENITHFRNLWNQLIPQKMELLPSATAIQAILIPGEENVRKAAQLIQKRGYDVRPILPPTVEKNVERLRICLHSFNKPDKISGLVKALTESNINLNS